jgi:hypothetical protein
MNLIKKLSTIMNSTIIYSIGLYLVRDIVIHKEGRFIKRRVVYKVNR